MKKYRIKMGKMYLSRICLDHKLISNNYISSTTFNFENEIETGWIVKINENDKQKVIRHLTELFNIFNNTFYKVIFF